LKSTNIVKSDNKTVAKSASKSKRSPNNRGVETKVRAIIDPIIKSNNACKVKVKVLVRAGVTNVIYFVFLYYCYNNKT